ncbi:AAA family ATPase [Micromonospora taraxaci]|uniref:AAA family ATPase n=1 Tax=Micromonospora taraxaci TaxID=1316803 RepID=UPI0033B4DBB7
MSNRHVVITGGPGSGKTTLLDSLREAGHACVEEAGRVPCRWATSARAVRSSSE